MGMLQAAYERLGYIGFGIAMDGKTPGDRNMRGRYFRYIYENEEGNLFHIGSIYNKEKWNVTNWIYMVGSYYRHTQFLNEPELYAASDVIPKNIDILVLGGCTVGDVNKLVYITGNYRIKTIILPYLTPLQRLVLMEEASEKNSRGKEIHQFLKEPYLFLKKAKIGQIYFLYGNGENLLQNPEELGEGVHFGEISEKERSLIQTMEGRDIPVMRAGYIVENGWLFYFGVYGPDIHMLSDFTRDYFSHMENIYATSENLDEDYAEQTKRLVQEYGRKFGNSSAVSAVMFEGPIHASLDENESFVTLKEAGSIAGCRVWEGRLDTGCTIKCMHGGEYDVMQYGKRSIGPEGRFGMLLLGNANLNRYYPDIAQRFGNMRRRIRGIGIPNCGSGEDWNYQILNLFAEDGRLYWICNKHDITSVGVVGDIVLSSSQNRLLMLESHSACCFSGYIIPKEDLE